MIDSISIEGMGTWAPKFTVNMKPPTSEGYVYEFSIDPRDPAVKNSTNYNWNAGRYKITIPSNFYASSGIRNFPMIIVIKRISTDAIDPDSPKFNNFYKSYYNIDHSSHTVSPSSSEESVPSDDEITHVQKIDESQSGYDNWFKKLDNNLKPEIEKRLNAIMRYGLQNNKNDKKLLDKVGHLNLYEIRFQIGSGPRIYYTVMNDRIILLLGGDKNTQDRDIIQAKILLRALQNQ